MCLRIDYEIVVHIIAEIYKVCPLHKSNNVMCLYYITRQAVEYILNK